MIFSILHREMPIRKHALPDIYDISEEENYFIFEIVCHSKRIYHNFSCEKYTVCLQIT